jgi:hypothetical protein
MRVFLGVALLLAIIAAPVYAADRTVQNGIDSWVTMQAGGTYVDFSKNPIPAGFFCASSAPFTGKVEFRGEPIVTNIPGAFKNADTIVQRLDDAAFDRNGVAMTRLQVRALSLKSVEPITTSCGMFDLSVGLDGTQPTTRMRIVRENQNGGRFMAPLALNTKVTFTRVGQPNGPALELSVPVRFSMTPNIPWSTRNTAPAVAGFVLVDTDNDRKPDTYLPGTSNFIAGRPGRITPNKPGQVVGALYQGYYCHSDPEGHQHCVCYDFCPQEP